VEELAIVKEKVAALEPVAAESVEEPAKAEEPVVEDQWVEKRWTRVNGSLKKVMYMNLNTNEYTKERQDNIVEIIYIGREEMMKIISSIKLFFKLSLVLNCFLNYL
jgi:hypothetical protein